MACPAAPWEANFIGPNYIMDGWYGEEKPECPLCLGVIEDGTNFFEATNSPGVACWECYLKYCVTRIRQNLPIFSPPNFRDHPVEFTLQDLELLKVHNPAAAAALVANGKNIILSGMRRPLATNGSRDPWWWRTLPLAHPKSLKNAAEDREHDRREENYQEQDGDWQEGD